MGATAYRAIDPSVATLAQSLADRFTFVSYDRRGRGESGDTPTYAVAREIEDIAALIGVVGGKAALYGGSSGAVLAIEAAAAGLPITKLALYEPPFVVEPGWPELPADYVETLDRFIPQGKPGAAAEYFMQTIGQPPEQIEGMKQSPFWNVLEGVAPTIAYDGRVMFDAYYRDHQFPRRWSKVTMPALVINGDATFPFIAASVEAVAKALPNATRRTLAGQGHGPAPEVIGPVLAEFIGA